jgi:Raf kinase inhibitor-like YbhB/YbcL family protein
LIPEKHSAYGADVSPALQWSGVPQGAKALVLMMEDPDAASPKPFTHWLIANIPSTATSLPAALPKSEKLMQPGGAMHGANNAGTLAYYGPKPPPDDPVHHYHFQVFALDRVLRLPSGFNRQALLNAMKGHVLAKGDLVGTYQRVPASRVASQKK